MAWQLGHNDFARQDQLAAYMGLHVTLTGLRGSIAPFLGIILYAGWQHGGFCRAPGKASGRGSLALRALLADCLAGGFMVSTAP